MITDDERREVAQKLRGLPIDKYSTIDEWEKDGLFISNDVIDEADYSQIHDAVFGCFPAEHMHPGDYEELHERLADLIDRPTCAIVESYMGGNLEYVEETPYHVLSCGHVAYGEDDPMFCPVCGAAVTDD